MTKSVLFKPIPLDLSQPKMLRSSILPLSNEPHVLIAPAAICIIRGATQRTLKPHIFWVDGGCAPFFDIIDIHIGVESQTTSYGAIPASMFALRRVKVDGEDGSGVEEVITPGYRVNWPIIEVGQLVNLHILNCSDTPRRFRAALEGHVQY